jgi:hypothetical protein
MAPCPARLFNKIKVAVRVLEEGSYTTFVDQQELTDTSQRRWGRRISAFSGAATLLARYVQVPHLPAFLPEWLAPD